MVPLLLLLLLDVAAAPVAQLRHLPPLLLLLLEVQVPAVLQQAVQQPCPLAG
jgi:hypothetical protein